MVHHIVCVGAIYIDTILTVPKFPVEDEKLRATSHARRRGGNCANTLEVLSQLVSETTSDLSDDDNESEAPTSGPQLHLLAVLPEATSADVAFIRKSLRNVGLAKSCIFRPGFRDAAVSYIIQNTAKNTRTMVSHTPLPEMTAQEFVASSRELHGEGLEQGWYHFEGTIPHLLLACVEHLRSDHTGFKISVECEKPERAQMISVAKCADVVFFSRLWAESQGYKNPVDFLKQIETEMQADALLCCTWGDKGASILQNRPGAEGEWAHVHSWSPESEAPQVVDTIGAGDTFIAGMLYALARHENDWSLQSKLNFANEIAGRKVYQVGFSGLGTLMRPVINHPLAAT